MKRDRNLLEINDLQNAAQFAVHQTFKRMSSNRDLRNPSMLAPPNSADSRWLLAERVAASPAFIRSSRLAQLLLFLCRHHLANEDERLSEQAIAADVFGRVHGLDSASDTIVRSHMLRLRQKLEAYFSEEGASEELRITIPRGRYIPHFHPAQTAIEVGTDTSPSSAADGEEPVDALPRGRMLSARWAGSIAAVVLCVVCIAGVVGLRVGGQMKRSATRQLWRQLFPQHSTTLFVAADSGLVLLHGITGENTTLSEYVSHDLHRAAASAVSMEPGTALSLASRRYTSFVDLEIFNRLSHVPEALAGSYSIRYSRDISINDLKTANVIFSGSADANPWVETFEENMNFVLTDNLHENIRAFTNRQPQPGEPAKYVTGKAEYGVLAFLSNPSGNGNALIIEGTSVAGTESASDFLFNSNELEPFLEKIRRADGSVPHFEVIVSTESLNGSASPLRTLAWRVHND
jgi:succinate dehydrogenase hydrophobic anchor subunit